MKLISRQRYKIIIADNVQPPPNGYLFSDFYIPVPPHAELVAAANKEINKMNQYLKYHFGTELTDDSQKSDSDSEEEEEELQSNSFVFPTFGLHEDYYSDPIDDEELQELIEILNTIVRSNPSLLRDSRPVIDIDIYKYSLETATGEEFTWEVEYYIHEEPSIDDY